MFSRSEHDLFELESNRQSTFDYDRPLLLSRVICSLQGNDITWYAPSSLEELAKLKSDFPDAKLITGNTECRLEQKFRKIEYAKQIYTRGIKEICQIKVTDDFIEIGSGIEFSSYGQ